MKTSGNGRSVVRFLLVLTVALSLWTVQPASAGNTYWLGTTTTNWSAASSWSSAQQTYYNEVFFNGSGANTPPNTAINNWLDSTTVAAQVPIYQLDYNCTNKNYTTFISPGVSLTLGAGHGYLYVGADQKNSANTPCNVANAAETITITGDGGTLNVGGVVRVGQGCSTSASLHNVTLDLSGLGTFLMTAVNGSRIAIPAASQPRAQGTVYLAKTNIVILANDLEIGYLGGYSNTMPCALYLGKTNYITTGSGGNTITVGYQGCTNAFLGFNPAFVGGGSTPSAYFGSSVSGGRTGVRIGLAGSGLTPCYGLCDFTSGNVSVMASTLQLGIAGAATINALGVLTFNNGVVDANYVTNGNQSVSSGGYGAGIINLTTNATLKVNNVMVLAAVTGTLTPGTAGTLNMDGGTLIANLITNGAGVGTINMTNAIWQVVITPGITASANATVTAFNPSGATNLVSVTFASLPSTYPVTTRLVKYQTLGGIGIANMGLSLPTGGGYVGYLTNNTSVGAIDLVLTAGASPSSVAWSGTDGSGNWDVANTVNWTNGTGASTVYNQLDSVRFDDTASGGTTSVNLVGTLTPSGLKVTNNSVIYTFGGTGSLGGAGVVGGAIPGGLVKQGPGTLILANTTADTYLGGVNIAAGVLQVGDGSTYGSGSLGPSIGAVVNNGGLVVNRPSGDTFALGNVVSGAGGLTNAGVGTLQLNNANTFTGPVAVQAGATLQLGNNAALGTSAGGTFVAAGATLDLNGKDPGSEPITVSGTGVGGVGAVINNNAGNAHLGAVTLAGDVLFAGSQRWDLTNTLSASSPRNVTMANVGYCEWRDLNASTAVNNLNINSGTLGWVGSTTAGTGGTLEVAGSATLKFYNDGALTANVTKPVVLDDGSIVANDSGANLISAPISLNGYDTFDISGTSLTLSGALSGIGTLYKQTRTSPLYITGTSPSFSGTVLLYAGKIYLNGSLGSGISSSITSQSGTVLAGTGVNNGPVDVLGGLTPGDAGVVGTNTFGSLTLEGSAMLTNDLAATASGASDLIVVNGALTMNNSTIYIKPITTLEGNRAYTLITYSGSFSGSLPAVQTASPSVYTIMLTNVTTTTPKKIQAIVTGGQSDLLVWDNASGNAEWDVQSSGNWSNTVTHVGNDVFYSSDAVLLNDSITNSAFPVTAIDIASGVVVAPSAITNNSTANYTITGDGAISGGASIVKMGSSTLTLSNANDFTGPVTILGGTVQAGSATALGGSAGTITITNGGTLDAGYPLGTKPIVVSGAGVGGNGAIVNNNSPHIWDSSGGLTTTMTLAGDTTFGGTNRWDFGSPTGATLSTRSNAYNLSFTGPVYREWEYVTIDTNLANIDVLQGSLGFKGMGTTGLGNPTNTITVHPGTTLTFYYAPSGGDSGYSKKIHVMTNATVEFRSNIGTNNYTSTLVMDDGSTLNLLPASSGIIGPVLLGTVSLSGLVHIQTQNSDCVVSNVISGTGGFYWNNYNNQLAFGAANTYSGPTIIGSGLALALFNSGSMLSSTQIVFVGTDTNGLKLDASTRSDQTLTLTSGQTLLGTGRMLGNLIESPGATVSPGTNVTLSAITASGAVTLNGTTTMKLNGSGVNDILQSGTSISYGGTLNLEFLSGTLAAGNSWKLFSAPGSSYSGSFTIAPAAPGTGLAWAVSTLDTDGTLRVVSTVVPQPGFTGLTIAGGNLTLSGTNGPHSGTYYVLSSTDVAQALTNWTRVSTNQFDASGNFTWTTNTLSIDPARFFRLQVQ